MAPELYSYGTPSPFPPSFDGSPFAYALGLFGDVVTSALGVMLLVAFVVAPSRKELVLRCISQISPPPRPLGIIYALGVYRVLVISLLLVIVMRSAPDMVWMLAWGEVSEPLIRELLALDLAMDGVAVIPGCAALVCWAIGGQVIEQQLVEAFITRKGKWTWAGVWKYGRVVLLVLLISIGVTMRKAAGG